MRLRHAAIAVSLAAPALSLAQSAKPDSAPPPIEDNSFLGEEAYNQEKGVVQHISVFQHAPTGRAWNYSFTQEWPVASQKHQLSYTVPLVRSDVRGASPKFGDLAINYRYQLLSGERLWVSPRVSAVLPTGSASEGTGMGGAGVQVNVPMSLTLSRQFVSHTDVGGTLVPRGETRFGDRLRSANLTLAQSVIWLARPTFNLMLETVYSSTHARVTPASGRAFDAPDDNYGIVSPGVRYAINFASGLQVVPGAALPITIRRESGTYGGDAGVLLYLSFEHPFTRQ